MGAADVFAMGPSYAPGEGMRRFLSGTPPIVGMLALQDTLELIERGRASRPIRAKSVALTEFAVRLADELLAPLGVTLASPRDAASAGRPRHAVAPAACGRSRRGCGRRTSSPTTAIPAGCASGSRPLSTSFTETLEGMRAVRAALV